MVKSRIRKLEEKLGGGECHEKRGGIVVVYRNKDDVPALIAARRCSVCGELPSKNVVAIPDNGRWLNGAAQQTK
jgi:hypothetical protein